MTWDNIPHGSAADFRSMDAARERADALEKVKEIAYLRCIATARESVQGFTEVLNLTGDTPYCPDDDALANALMREWHAAYCEGTTAHGRWLAKAVANQAEIDATESANAYDAEGDA